MSRTDAVVVHELDCAIEGERDAAPGAVRWRTLFSGDRTPTDSLTVGVAELEPGGSRPFRPHRHAQPETYYILSGEGLVTVSGKDHPVRAGSSVYIPGGALHGARCTGSEPLRLLYVFPSDSFADVVYEFPDA